MCNTRRSANAMDPSASISTTSSRRRHTPRSSAATSSSTTTASSTDTSSAAASGTSAASSSTSLRRPAPRSSAATSSSTTTASSTSRFTTDISSAAASGTSAASNSTSPAGIPSFLPENPLIYSFSEIASATNNFLGNRLSSSSSSSAWRCSLRGKDVAVFQRKLHRLLDLRPLLSSLCKSHHSSIIPLRGASLSSDHIYLVYDFVSGPSLSDTLRNPKNPNFTILDTWLSRLHIAADLSSGLHYIHRSSGLDLLIHNHLKSSSIIVSDPDLHAKICHFGTAQLTGELSDSDPHPPQSSSSSASASTSTSTFTSTKGSKSSEMKMKGTVGYMAPEFSRAGIVSQKTDVYAFGVILLELLSGQERVTTSVIESAREAIGESETDRNDGRLRQWVDRSLRDSYPVEVAARLIRVALDCVHVEADKRPDMERVVGKVSMMFMESERWAEKLKIPTDFCVSMEPR